MNKLITLISLTCLLLLFSCKKNYDLGPDQTTTEMLIGNWSESSSILIRYNGSWAKISEETKPFGTASFYNAGKFDGHIASSDLASGSYNVSSDAYGEYLNVTSGNNSLIYKIEDISARKLILTLETRNVTYYVNDIPYTAAKSIQTITLFKM